MLQIYVQNRKQSKYAVDGFQNVALKQIEKVQKSKQHRKYFPRMKKNYTFFCSEDSRFNLHADVERNPSST